MENNETLIDYIPIKNYNDSKTLISRAISQFNKGKNYDFATYLAILSTIETETAKTIAKTKLLHQKMLFYEKEKLIKEKETLSATTLKLAIAKANLKKEGQAYKKTIFDEDIFIKRNKFVITQKGKNLLDKIFEVLKVHPQSRLIVVGHTRKRDRNNIKSMKKAESISEYLTATKGFVLTRISIKGMGNSYPIEVRKKMRTKDRIEIIITGIE